MEKAKKWMDQGIAFVTCTVLAVMVLMAVWQVFSRYVLNAPSTISEEFLRFALIWVSMLGAAYAFGNKKHLAIELFVHKVSKKNALKVSILIEVIVLLFASLVMIVGGVQTIGISLGQSSPALGIPMAAIYLSLPVSGILIICYSLFSIYESAVKRKAEFYSEDMETEWPATPLDAEGRSLK
ncbi:TRAP transporter small permease [Rossellomorea vietnamensis]|uniref:TRAP transporter small permease n=1 Tax=Rossellomorea vietnamensis TaxID=218284 RepID=UPI003CF2E5EB